MTNIAKMLTADFLIAGIKFRLESDRDDVPFRALAEDLALMIAPEPFDRDEADILMKIYPRDYDEPSPLKLPASARMIRRGGRKVFEDEEKYFIDFHENAFFVFERPQPGHVPAHAGDMPTHDRSSSTARCEGVCYVHPDLDPMFWTEICLNHVLALLLRQKGRYLIHAGGAVDDNGNAVLFTGQSHSGKSTAALCLAQAGWCYLGDDIVLFDKNFLLYPYPKLAAALEWTVETLGLQRHVIGRRQMGKFIIRPWSTDPSRPSRIFNRTKSCRIFLPLPPMRPENSSSPLDESSSLEIIRSQTQFCHTDILIGGPMPDLAPLAACMSEIRIGDLAGLSEFLKQS